MRREAAEKRHHMCTEIMEAEPSNEKLFYKIIRRQREGPRKQLARLYIDGVNLSSPDDIREGWSMYFSKLSIPEDRETYDQQYKQLVDRDITNISEICEEDTNSNINVTTEAILEAICSMKNGKSPDGQGIRKIRTTVASMHTRAFAHLPIVLHCYDVIIFLGRKVA